MAKSDDFIDHKFMIPVLPLRDMLVFPNTVTPLFVGRSKSIKALEYAREHNGDHVLLVTQRNPKTNDPIQDDLYQVGTVAKILQLLKLPDNTVKVLVEGCYRAEILDLDDDDEYSLAQASIIDVDSNDDDPEVQALLRTVKIAFDNYVRLNKQIPPETLLEIASISDNSRLADTLVKHLSNLKTVDKQDLLEEPESAKRLEKIYSYIQSEIEIMRVEKKIRSRVKRQIERTQKEYYLNEQMSAIQKELGDKEDGVGEIQEIEDLLNSKKLPKEAKDRITKELKKLKQMSAMSAEATVVRNYIDTLLALPWQEYSEEIRDIVFAEKVLNDDHYGLKKVKERVLEFLAVQTLVNEIKGPILCLVGPPGVGKTSLAKSVAAATGREFVRIALGGVRDEAEIRGHRRTYIGSMPGKILLGLKKIGTSNPVMLLDEIDKLTRDMRGDPSSALLEVLDPEQNHTFQDHYVDLDYDLSKVLFMATANSLHTIPKPLLDRMEVIEISGYTEDEKEAIAGQYLIPKQIEANGLKDCKVTIGPKAIREIVRHYTKESGVRSLDREIASVCRKVARKHVEKAATKKLKDLTENITVQAVKKLLGPHKFEFKAQNATPEIGVCTGLSVSQVGGDILPIEVVILPGKGKLTLTGKLGDVMQESAQAALSYIRSRSDCFDLEKGFYKDIDMHIHVPEGAIPKDGPSAGTCMATAVASALLDIPVCNGVAMTGEITLRGRVLPIGGLKEKLIAAHRSGLEKVLIPIENEKDLQDVPKKVRQDLEIIPCKHMDEILLQALVWGDNKESRLYSKLQDV